MSGQDPTMVPSTDTMEAVVDTQSAALFEISQVAGDVIPVEGGLEMLQKVQVIIPVWLFFYLFVLLGFLAWIRLYYGNILMQTVQASTNFQVATRMFKDNSMLQKQLDNILYSFYFLSVAFLLYLMENRLHLSPYGLQGGRLYLFNIALLLGAFLARIVLSNLSGFLFNSNRVFREYLYNIFIFNKLLGIAILPLLLFMVYTTGRVQEIFHWMALMTVALIVVMRLIRIVVFSLKKDVLIFYMFLYLCALEIVPLALLYKWLEGIL
ncbi:MAG: DUF4271 domain-containing protein [Bacteroidales bacterium]|nr:DUF4271 domain-containing protein [Bacteroidales bacterium]